MSLDEYPNDVEVKVVAEWKINNLADCTKLLEYVRTLWKYADRGYWIVEKGNEEHMLYTKTVYSISTGGWSGNETLIGALESNWAFWTLCWYSSCRGGHYKFEVRDE